MKNIKLILLALVVTLSTQINAQTADEIIANYFENTGGLDNWNKIEGIKLSAKVNNGGMEIPIEIIQLKSGKQMTAITFQGKKMYQGVFDGETLWGTNFQTQKAEKRDAESTAMMKLEANDFPDSFLNYKDKGYTVELMGKEDFNGTETFKIKLVKEPVVVDGKEEESISYYFFDTENYVPLGMQSEIKAGQGKGVIQEITFSDYQEVEGVYFPFSMTQGVKGGQGQPITFDSIELNPEVDENMFKFPEEEATKDGDNKN